MPEEQEYKKAGISCSRCKTGLSSFNTNKATLHQCLSVVVVCFLVLCQPILNIVETVDSENIMSASHITPPDPADGCEMPKNDSNGGMKCECEKKSAFLSSVSQNLFALPWLIACLTFLRPVAMGTQLQHLSRELGRLGDAI